MHIKTTFWLFVAVLFTGGLLVFVNLREAALWEGGGEAGRLVLAENPEDAEYLRVETPDWQAECRKERGRWRLKYPIEGGADPAVVDRILAEWGALSREETVTAAQMARRGLTWDSYGLERPRVRLTLGFGGGREATLALGAQTPMESGLFVRRGGEEAVIVTPTNIWAAIPGAVTAFWNRRLWEGDPAAVVRLDLERREGGYVQIARENGDWRVRQPFEDWADPERVRMVLQEIWSGEVEAVVASGGRADPSAYGLGTDTREAALTVWMAGQEKGIRLLTGRAGAQGQERMYVQFAGSSSIFAVSTNWAGALRFRAADLRARRRLRFEPGRIREFAWQTGERRLTARRGEGPFWLLTEPAHGRGDRERIRLFLEELAGLQARGFVEDPARPAGEPVVQIALWTQTPAEGSDPARLLRVYAPPDDGLFRADIGTGIVFQLDPVDVERLFGPAPHWDPLRFRDREMLGISAAQIRSVTRLRGGEEQSARREADGRWTDPDGRPLRAEAVEELAAAAGGIRALRLEAYEADRLAAYGFETPLLRLEFGLDGGDGIRKMIVVGALADSSSNRYARVQGQDPVFVISAELTEFLNRDWTP